MKRVDALEWLEKDLDRVIKVCESHSASISFIKELYDAGVERVEVETLDDLHDPEDLTRSAIYVTLKFPISKSLFKMLMELRPDEFKEIKPGTFRLWWD